MLAAAGVYLALSLGANDGANALAAAVGARVRSTSEATWLIALFGLLGALTLGGGVSRTLGEGIVRLDLLAQPQAVRVAAAALLAAGTWTLAATRLGLPVSTTHAAAGALLGAFRQAADAPVEWARVAPMAFAWILTLPAAAIGAWAVLLLLRRLPLDAPAGRRAARRLLTWSGAGMAFAWGGNDVANVAGAVSGAGLMGMNQAVWLSGAAMSLGVILWGRRIIRTLGGGITRLDPVTALAAEAGAAAAVLLFTQAAMPVSTTHAVTAGVAAVGLARGRRAVDRRLLLQIAAAWCATPLFTASLAAVFHLLLALGL